MSSTWFPTTAICTRCGKPEHGSIACDYAAGWPEPPKVEVTGLDPYFVHERIATALERIAAAMEQNTGKGLDE